MLKFIGLYVSSANENQRGDSSQAYRYFRFYKDGRVLCVVSTGNTAQVAC